jgi:hypothetical protein
LFQSTRKIDRGNAPLHFAISMFENVVVCDRKVHGDVRRLDNLAFREKKTENHM